MKDIIAGLYPVGLCVSFLYYSWVFAKEHGFLAWLIFGEILPFAKAVFWPLWVIIALFSH